MSAPPELAPLIDEALGNLAITGDPDQAIAQVQETVGPDPARAIVHACVQVIACVQEGEPPHVAFTRLQELGISAELAEAVIERVDRFGGAPDDPVIDAELRDGVGVVHLDGRWEELADDQQREIAGLLETVLGDTSCLVFSLGRLASVQVDVLAQLLAAAPRVTPAGGRVVLAAVPEPVVGLLAPLGYLERLPTFATVEEALASLEGAAKEPVPLAAPLAVPAPSAAHGVWVLRPAGTITEETLPILAEALAALDPGAPLVIDGHDLWHVAAVGFQLLVGLVGQRPVTLARFWGAAAVFCELALAEVLVNHPSVEGAVASFGADA